jgi:hypothetical protein
MMIFRITTLSIKGLFVTLTINDIQHNNTPVSSAIMLSIVILSVAIYLMLC